MTATGRLAFRFTIQSGVFRACWGASLRLKALTVRASPRRRKASSSIWPIKASASSTRVSRFTDATYAYQVGGKGFPGEKVEALEKWTLGGFAPDLTLLFDIAPAVAAARLRARAGDQDRFERMGEAFFTRVREAYLARAAAAPERFLIINADRPAKDVSADIFARISSWL